MFNRFCVGALLLVGFAVSLTGCGSSPSLTSIAITPNATVTVTLAPPTIPQGFTQYTAIGSYTHPGHPAETKDITKLVTWQSSGPQVATVNSSGLATATGFAANGIAWTGNTTITASAPGFPGEIVSNPVTFTVTACTICSSGSGSSPEAVVSLTITPSTDTVAVAGQTGQFVALATTGAGLVVDMTTKVAWDSTNVGVATIGPNTGLATAVGAGTTPINALYTNPDGSVVAASATFTVTGSASEPLQSLAITPSTEPNLSVGQTTQLIALGTFSPTASTPGIQNLTSSVTWSSSNTSVATITSGGLVTGVGAGATAITAIAMNPDKSIVTATASITVVASGSAEPLISLAIVPDSQSVSGPGQTNQFLAIGTFSASSSTPGTQNMANISTYTVTWYSSNPSVATISNTAPSAGVATAVGQGTTAITAIATNTADKSSSFATATFTVTGSSSSEISSLTIIPATQTFTLPLVTPAQISTPPFVVIGTNGTTGLQQNETNGVSWTSSNPQVATISNTGLVTLVSQGSTNITAQYTNPASGTTPLNVVTVTGTLNVNGQAAEPLLSLALLPGSQSIAFPGQSTQLIAIGTFSQAPVTQDLTDSTKYPITWTSSNTGVATVCNATGTPTVPVSCAATPGLVTAVGQGTAAITAIAPANNPADGSVVTGVASVTVTNGVAEQVTALTIIPGSLSLSATGQPGQFVALGTSGTTGLQQDVTNSPQLAWSSSIPTIATVCTPDTVSNPSALCPTTPGQAQGVSAGSTNITAEWTNPKTSTTPASVVTAQASVSVTNTPAAEPLLSIAALPSATTDLDLEGTAQFLAYGTFSTAPTVLDITNGFFHAGFNSANATCTAPEAAANTQVLAADSAANLPVNNLPNPQCVFVPTTWVSTAPFIFPINSAGTAGATGGLSTADGSGNADIYAVASNPDSTLVYSPIVTFACPYAPPTYGTISVTDPATNITTTTTDYNDLLNPGTCNTLTIADSLLTTLNVFNAGVNTTGWLVTADSATLTQDVIHCGGSVETATPEGSVCEATYPNGTLVTLTATSIPATNPVPAVNFGGWSDNCTPCTLGACFPPPPTIPPTPPPVVPITATGPNYCYVQVGGGCTLNQNTGAYTCSDQSNVSVGAIFN